jgi:hypothetical protein
MSNTNPSWFADRIRELGELLRRLPDARQRAFRDALDASGASQGDDHAPDEAKPASGDVRAAERQQDGFPC